MTKYKSFSVHTYLYFYRRKHAFTKKKKIFLKFGVIIWKTTQSIRTMAFLLLCDKKNILSYKSALNICVIVFIKRIGTKKTIFYIVFCHQISNCKNETQIIPIETQYASIEDVRFRIISKTSNVGVLTQCWEILPTEYETIWQKERIHLRK